MATKQITVDFITEQITAAGVIRSRKMFGEYAIYCNEKVVALVCDDQLFVKPTNAGRMFIETIDERPAYPGAKPYFYISGDLWEDHQWLTELIAKTAEELPAPKPKKKR
jgi:DNA transformation protein